MSKHAGPRAGRLNRRDIFRSGGLAVAGLLGGSAANASPARTPPSPDIYARIGVRPFINLTSAVTINGGLLTLPEVKQAMEEASYFSVNIDELMDGVGRRIAELVQCEAAIVTSGCAAALTHATSACLAGSDPERIQQLPDLRGLKTEVIMPKQSRNTYDHAIRALGVTMVTVDTREEFYRALSHDTAMIAVLGSGEAHGKIRLEEMAEAGRKRGIPILVDASPEWPQSPDPYLTRGADLVAYSGGKICRGPQCSGFLMGRQDLVQAAWLNGAPHHSFGRMMKIGKEEIMGALAALEVTLKKRSNEQELRKWNGWLRRIAEGLKPLAGVQTELFPPPNTNPNPYLKVSWSPDQIAMTAGELHEILMQGEPRMQSSASGNGHSFHLRVGNIRADQIEPVIDRLSEVFRSAPRGPREAAGPPAVDLSGRWDAELTFTCGSARHLLFFEADGADLRGTHQGRISHGELQGTIGGRQVEFRSTLRHEGARFGYVFTGSASADEMSGDVDLGEYGKAQWRARRHRMA